jgi:hypothetical protein
MYMYLFPMRSPLFDGKNANQNAKSKRRVLMHASYQYYEPLPVGGRLVLVGTVNVAAESVRTRDSTVLADSTWSQRPADGAAVVANAEGIGADTDESTILGARCARRGAVALGVGGA